jgi:hypothetical protein
MAISFRSEAHAGVVGGASLTITKPANLANNDVLKAALQFSQDPGVFSAPSGWTRYASGLGTGGNQIRFDAYRKVISNAAGEPASYVFDWSGTGQSPDALGAIEAWIGVDNTTPIDVTASTNQGNSASEVASGITTVTNGCQIVGDFSNDQHEAITKPGGTTERYNLNTGAGNNAIESSDDNQASAGATGTRTATTVGTDNFVAILTALRPAAGAAAAPAVSDDRLWRGPAYLRITPRRTDDGGLTPPAVTTLVQGDPYRIARMNAPAVRIPPTDWSSATIGGAPAPSAVPGDDTRSKPSLLSRVLKPQFDSGGITTSPAVSAVSGDDVRSKLPLLIKPPQPGFDSGGMFTGAPAPSAAPGDDTRSKPPLLSRIPQPVFDAGGIISTPAASAVPGDDTRSKPPFLSRVPQTGFESGGMTSTPAASAVPGDDPRQSPRWLPKSVPPRVDDAPQTTPLNISTDDPAVQRIVRAVQLLKPKFDSDGIFAPAAVGAVLTDNEYRVVRSLLVIYRLNQIDFTSDTTKLSAAAARLLTRLILGVGL